MADIEEMFTIEYVAKKWHLSPSYIRKLICQGKLKAEPLGGRNVRISESAIQTFRENSRNKEF